MTFKECEKLLSGISLGLTNVRVIGYWFENHLSDEKAFDLIKSLQQSNEYAHSREIVPDKDVFIEWINEHVQTSYKYLRLFEDKEF